MNWFILIIAGLFEVAWAIGLKYTNGFSQFWPSVFTIVAIIVSMALLALAMRALPVGTAYAVWVGIGIIGTTVLGIVLFNEPISALRLVCIAVIILGIVGLKLSAAS